MDNADEVDDTKYNRRKVLKAFGAVALSGATATAFSMDKENVGERMVQNIYGSVDEMTRDRSLKEGVLVRTVGYYRAGDGGNAEYLVMAVKPDIEAGTIILSNKLYAVLMNTDTVNYQMFGTRRDGTNDDGIQIKAAHAYANHYNIPVVNLHGEYWIKQTNGVEIRTNVQWGHSIFHIDEKFNTTKNSRFIVSSRHNPVVLEFDADVKSKILSQLKPGVTLIPEFAPYKGSLIVVSDANDRIGARTGASYRGRVAKPREEFFFVEEHGRILGDLAWAFKDYTKIVAYPADDNFLVLDGGTFYLSGESVGPASGAYFQMGFSITRSRTIIRNQWMGLEPGKPDLAMSPRRGCYSYHNVYDVLLENVRLLPWEKNRPGADKDVPQGTYGIGGNYVLNATFRNVTAEGSPIHWGVFGTNLFKNFRVEQCVLNRIDVHFYCMNLYIKDSQIGTNGITITGGGDLFIENTTCRSNSFISFRRDYGARWDGHIRIRNCRHAPAGDGSTAILSMAAENFDYKYPIGYGRTIKVEDIVVDFSSVPSSRGTAWLMRLSSFSQAADGHRVFFPYHLEFKNITVQGRAQGIRLLAIPDPQFFRLSKAGSYDRVQIRSNCKMVFEDIQLEDLSADTKSSDNEAHLIMKGPSAAYKDQYALYPEVRITRCNNLKADFGGSIAEVFLEQCSVTALTGSPDNRMPGALTFSNCKFEPVVKNDKLFYLLNSELGTSFINCVIYAPRKQNIPHPELTDRIGFIRVNRDVLYNHINTRLGNDILSYYKEKGIKLTPSFIAMLMVHSQMEA